MIHLIDKTSRSFKILFHSKGFVLEDHLRFVKLNRWPLKGPFDGMNPRQSCGPMATVMADDLTSESVKGSSLSFQGIDDIHGGDGLSLGMLGVGDSISDDVFQENLEDTTGFFVDQTRNTLDTTSSSQSSDGWLGNSLDVISKNLSMTLCSSFSESLSSLSTSRHVELD